MKKARDICRHDILFAVTPERGRGSIHLTSLARISIPIRLNQVGSCHGWWGLRRARRAGDYRTPSRCWTWGSDTTYICPRLHYLPSTRSGELSAGTYTGGRGASRTAHQHWVRIRLGGHREGYAYSANFKCRPRCYQSSTRR